MIKTVRSVMAQMLSAMELAVKTRDEGRGQPTSSKGQRENPLDSVRPLWSL